MGAQRPVETHPVRVGRIRLAALAAVILAAAPAAPTRAQEPDALRAARLSTLAAPAALPRLEARLTTLDGLPREAFRRDETVAVQVGSSGANAYFALLVDSHGVVSLLGEELDGWLAGQGSEAGAPRLLLGEGHWKGSLPLGRAHAVIYAVSGSGREEIEAGLSRIDPDEGIVPEVAIDRLAGLLASASDAGGIRAARTLEIHLVHPKPAASRSLGQPAAVASAPPPLVDREEILHYFTGPRSRAIQRVRLDLYIPFDFDEAEVRPGSRRQIEEFAAAIRDPRARDLVFRVGGHSDRTGSRDYNLELSSARAANVRRMLVEEFGIDGSRLRARGFAFDRPLDPADTEEAHSVNRRVDFEVVRE